jgi:hypothetical protein
LRWKAQVEIGAVTVSENVGQGGLNAAWHVEQIISTDIASLNAREAFVPGFLILFFHLS